MGVVSNFRHRFQNLFFTPILYGSIASLALFLSAWETGDRVRDRFQERFRKQEDTFDFIIVGAGSAGSILANRLSENYDVLLLEAGGEPHPFQSVPGLTRFLMNYRQVDWGYRTTQQKRSCLISNNKECSWSGGKGLGGSGNLGMMAYLRGNPRDYDNWARITGDDKWSYDEILPYFRKIEDFYGNSTDPDAHGHGGELRVELPDYVSPAKEFLWAAHELGYTNVDLNGRYVEGFDAMYYSIKKGVRQSPYRAFIKPIRKRKTLTIRKFAHVTKLMLRNNDNGAYGLEYQKHGKLQKAYAQREIVLAAGAIQTPRILLLSGIGDETHLKDMGIKCRYNSPAVGQNLQDHLSTYVGPFFINEARTLLLDRDITSRSFLEYGAFGKGPLTTSGEMAAGVISSIQAKNRGEGDWPDMKLSLMGLSVYKNFAADMAHGYNLKRDTVAEYYKHAVGQESFHMGVSVGRPLARGEIRLTGKDPLKDDIVIDPNYLEDPWDLDLKVMLEGVKTALFMVENTTVYQNLGGRFTKEVLPGCEHLEFRSDAYWECYIRKFAISSHDYVGTCAMGKSGERTACVDSELRVIGAKNLRVIDASVIPSIPVGNTEASVLMLAAKGADMMAKYWDSQEPEDCCEHYSGFANSQRPGNTRDPPREVDAEQIDDEEGLNVQAKLNPFESVAQKYRELKENFNEGTRDTNTLRPSSISVTSSKLLEDEILQERRKQRERVRAKLKEESKSKPKSKTQQREQIRAKTNSISHATELSKRMKSSKPKKSSKLRSENVESIEEEGNKPEVNTNTSQDVPTGTGGYSGYPVFPFSPNYQLSRAVSTQEFTYTDNVAYQGNDPQAQEEKRFDDSIYVVKTKANRNGVNQPLQDTDVDFSEQNPTYMIIKRKSDQNIEKENTPQETPYPKYNLPISNKDTSNNPQPQSSNSPSSSNHIYLPTYEVANSADTFAFSPQNPMSSLTTELQHDFTSSPVQSSFRLRR